MSKLHLLQLPFVENLYNLAEAMQYCFSDYNMKKRKPGEYDKYWLGEVYSNSTPYKINKVKAFVENHQEELNQNPLMNALLNAVIKTADCKTPEDYKAVYEEFQTFQKNYPIEEHWLDYMDMNCHLSAGYLVYDDNIKVQYPVFLYTAYTMHGGLDDDTRGGYLFPFHVLKKDEVEKLHDIAPYLFVYKVQENYEKMMGIETL